MPKRFMAARPKCLMTAWQPSLDELECVGSSTDCWTYGCLIVNHTKSWQVPSSHKNRTYTHLCFTTEPHFPTKFSVAEWTVWLWSSFSVPPTVRRHTTTVTLAYYTNIIQTHLLSNSDTVCSSLTPETPSTLAKTISFLSFYLYMKRIPQLAYRNGRMRKRAITYQMFPLATATLCPGANDTGSIIPVRRLMVKGARLCLCDCWVLYMAWTLLFTPDSSSSPLC